jgi:hypothetical protein
MTVKNPNVDQNNLCLANPSRLLKVEQIGNSVNHGHFTIDKH